MSRRPTVSEKELAKFAEFVRQLPLGTEAEMRPDGAIRVVRGGLTLPDDLGEINRRNEEWGASGKGN